jgi:tetratricopeptide (TPR) repeat protein
MRVFFLILFLAYTGNAFAQVVSVDQVTGEIKAGAFDKARTDLDKVLRVFPDSARAQFMDAVLSDRQGDWKRAANALDKAQSIDPKLSFANPQVLVELKNDLAAHGYKVTAPFPWNRLLWWIGGLLVALLFVAALFARARAGTKSC